MKKYIKKYLKCPDAVALLIEEKFYGKPFHELKRFLTQLKHQQIEEGKSDHRGINF